MYGTCNGVQNVHILKNLH